MLKYSVLMSVYKQVQENELILSLESMLNQTIPPDQVVIVVDGPISVSLRTLLDKYKNEYNNIITIENLIENQGLACALNAGLAVCRNELVARMDSDDYSLPNRCEIQLNEMIRCNDLVLLGTQMKLFSDSPKKPDENVIYRPCDYDDIKRNFRRNNPFVHSSVMFKKSVILKVGGYDSILRRRQDYDLFSKIVGQGYYAKNLEQVLLHFRCDQDFWLRNKNKDSCLSKIEVAKRIYKRKESSFLDYLYTCITMYTSYLLPNGAYKIIYKIFRRV